MTKPLLDALAIAAGGAAGSLCRWGAGVAGGRLWPRFPAGTLFVNLTGSFLLGWFLVVSTERVGFPPALRLAVAVGFIGAYTTFSTFMYESNALWDDGAFLKAGANLLLSVALGLLAVRLGIWAAGR